MSDAINGNKPKFTRGSPLPQPATKRLHVVTTTPNFTGQDIPPPKHQRGEPGLVKQARQSEFVRVTAGSEPDKPFIKAPSRSQMMSLRGQRPR
jgi:hypothetical protein